MNFIIDGDASQLQKEVDFLKGCCMEHPQDVPEITEVLGWHNNRGDDDVDDDGTEKAIWRTPDNKYAVLDAGEDYTGHGCQCGSSVQVFDTLEDALALGLGFEGQEFLRKP